MVGTVPKYSIVVPLHEEEENVTELYDRLKAVMEQQPDPFELVFVDAPFKNDMSAEVLTLLGAHQLVAPDGWIVVEQSKRAPAAPPAPKAHERVFVATIGDHRIAFYQRRGSAPATEQKS